MDGRLLSFNIIDLALIIAATQGFLLTTLIFHRHGRLFANRFLGMVIFLYSFILLDMFLWDINFYIARPHLRLITIGLPLAIAPMHYLYARYLTRSLSHLKKSDVLHLFPALAVSLYFGVRLLFFADIFTLFEQLNQGTTPLDFTLYNWLILLQAGVYLILTLVLLQRYMRDIRIVFSSVEKVQLVWLRNITLIIAAVVALFFIENILNLVGQSISKNFGLTSFVSAISIYVMGYMGLLKSEIFSSADIAGPMREMKRIAATAVTRDIAAPEKYAKSGLAEEQAKSYSKALQELMQREHPYRNSELTLPQLATMLNITPHNLSQVLSTQFQQNFFDFVNYYRLEEVKQNLSDPQKSHYKILALAFDAGFNSKTSFNTIFKKHTNKTPSQFRREALDG